MHAAAGKGCQGRGPPGGLAGEHSAGRGEEQVVGLMCQALGVWSHRYRSSEKGACSGHKPSAPCPEPCPPSLASPPSSSVLGSQANRRPMGLLISRDPHQSCWLWTHPAAMRTETKPSGLPVRGCLGELKLSSLLSPKMEAAGGGGA